jgi:hypothetical protein
MLSNFQQNFDVPTNFCRAANRKFNEHQSFTSRSVTRGQKDNIHKKPAGAFLQLLLAERSKESVIWRPF